MKRSSTYLGVLAVILAAGVSSANAPSRTPDVIGEVIDLNVPRTSVAFVGVAGRVVDGDASDLAAADAELIWSTELFFSGADYVAPHFSKFDLPPGAYVVVRSPDGQRSWTYQGRGKDLPNPSEGFWGIHIYGVTAVVELFSARPVAEGSIAIDRFARGFSADEMNGSRDRRDPLSLCSTDDSLWAKCYQTSEANAYNKSRAVARLMINGTGACTGWLVGTQGHVITNQHCITSASDAVNTTFEFMGEGATCTTDCATWGGCPGTTAATTSTLVKNSVNYDYALVQLPTNVSGTYGYMQLRTTGATLGERIYIPQHPAAWGKKIAMKDGTANATISSLNEPVCAGGTADVGYNADTQGGSSGSPVLGYSDNLVIALHHCGTCPNRAVPIQAVITDLGSLLPAGSTGGGPTTYSISGSAGTTGATLTAGTKSTTSDASGNYSLSGFAPGTYTVTPAKTGCTFSPTSLSVTVPPNATGKNFTATCTSTDIPLTSGVTLTGQSVAYQAWKYYYVDVVSGTTSLTFATTAATADVDIYTQSGGVKPTLTSYVCRPYGGTGNETCTATNPAVGRWYLGVYGYAAATYSVTATVVGSTPTYSIAGSAGTSGATLTAGTKTATSDASNAYTITGLTAGTYTVTPSKSGCTFSPTSLSVTVGPNATGKNFTATCSGAVTLFTDGFEGTGWSSVDTSGTAGAWTLAASGTHPTLSPRTGTKLGVFNSYTSAAGSQTRLYRTAGFAVAGTYTTVSLKFWMYHETGYTTAADKVQAQISTNGTTWTNVGTAVNRYTGSTGWAQASIDISAYKGQTVYVGFLGISAYGNDEYLDDITVTAQ